VAPRARRYLAYGGVYTLLEILAVPAVPLTMTAGVIFGPVAGSAVVSVAATAAATIAFLIARYAGAGPARASGACAARACSARVMVPALVRGAGGCPAGLARAPADAGPCTVPVSLSRCTAPSVRARRGRLLRPAMAMHARLVACEDRRTLECGR